MQSMIGSGLPRFFLRRARRNRNSFLSICDRALHLPTCMACSAAAAIPASSVVAGDGCPAAAAVAPMQQELMGKVKVASLTCLGSAISCASLVSSVYLIPFWTDVVGVGPRFMGIVIICAKIAEAVSVVSAGIFSDNCAWRLGRRRPFLMACIPAALVYALLFNPPLAIMSHRGAASAWVFAFGLAFFAVWPYLTVCHSSWCAEFCRDYAERNVLYGFRYFWGTIGTITGAILPLIVAAASGLAEKETRISNFVGYIVAIFIIVVSVFVFAFVSEKARPATENSVWKAFVSWVGQAFGAIRHSHVVRIHVLVSFLYDIALAYAVSFLPYMASRVQKLQTPLVLGSYVVVSLVFIPLWLKISQYFEKCRVCSAACVLQSGCLLAAGLVQKSMAYWGLLLCVAFSSAGVLVMMGSMRADVCDSEIVRVGKRREAVQISTCDVLNRLAGGLTFIGLFLLESGGYTPIRSGNSTSHPSQDGHEHALSNASIAHIRGLHCFFPAVCVAIAGLCLYAYPLNRLEHLKLVKAIAALDAPTVVVGFRDQEPGTPFDSGISMSLDPVLQLPSYSSSKVEVSLDQLEKDSAMYRDTPDHMSNLEA